MKIPMKIPEIKMQTLSVIKKDPKLASSCQIKLKKLDQNIIEKWTKTNTNVEKNNTQMKIPNGNHQIETKSNDLFSKKSELFNEIENNFNDKIENWKLADFSIGKPIGKGRFGKCYLAREKRTPFKWLIVLKILSIQKLEEDENENILKQEYQNQTKLNHPNILRICGHFYDEKRVFLMLEYAPNGNLFHKIINDQVTNELAAKYIYQTTKALIYIHSKNIIHRDLKPENILLGFYNEIKIADFGWSTEDNGKNDETAGTLEYLCPEMVDRKHHNKKVDNWCLGVLCYELVVGVAPFHVEGDGDEKEKNEELRGLIRTVNYAKEKILNKDAFFLIDNLLQRVPEKRLELVKVMNSKWIQDCADKDDTYEKYFKSF